jgi:GNAT superfamily N-acetyltransferase
MSIFDKYDLVDVDESFPIPDKPNEGLILLVGSSGSGKSTILKKWFGEQEVTFNKDALWTNFTTAENAESFLLACGLRSIPAWRRPYQQLSNGERHRAFCAKSLDMGVPYIDEFSSVVDRETAKALSFSIQKHFIRSNMSLLCIASCHTDIIKWLNPTGTYNTDSQCWSAQPRRCLRRPDITLDIRPCDGKEVWPIFKKHHYLSHSFNKSANSWVALLNNKPVAFCSALSFPCGSLKNAWREHRTVVLPEFQGLGIGNALSNTIAEHIVSCGCRYFSKTAHPAMGLHREGSANWRPTSKNKIVRLDYIADRKTKEDKYKMQHRLRSCYSHEYITSD